ncbi:hypothetical protein F0P96_03735 [Hymenobacter busanensis]|uniref:Uncharacterized protein n=1 Tax=Hymenobacter busanensis TaxID=2607656 RepID=A0A7L4ZTQ6_9BACT|nr:hypothetical protein [Hymenobacter busanensis]KAA9339738.1 hypothetical protein F0P96_03735 [Hymenobacter busanensis]QHJ06508.1 hypothetical protein GUY19_04015 [Hymenobacter busanensis]
MTAAFFRLSGPLLTLLWCAACTRPETQKAPTESPQATAAPAPTPAVAAATPDCRHPFGLYRNTELTYQITDNNNKPQGLQIMKVATITEHAAEKKAPAYTEVLLKSSLYDADNKLLRNDEYVFSCRNDSVLTDGRLLLDPAMLRSFRDRRFGYEPIPLSWPNQPAAGNLPNGQLTVEVSSPSVDIAKVITRVSRRRLIGPEAVTTPAGSFQAYKVESDYEYATQLRPDMIRRSIMRVVDFYVPTVGIVRTEFRANNGKLDRALVLTKRTDGQL